jgi:hypothetical protein
MRRILRALVISVLVVGVTAACNDKTGGGGGTKPGTGTSQNGGGGY